MHVHFIIIPSSNCYLQEGFLRFFFSFLLLFLSLCRFIPQKETLKYIPIIMTEEVKKRGKKI